jgi:hypothetical protein
LGPFAELVDGSAAAFAEVEGIAFDQVGGSDLVFEDGPEIFGR